MTFSFRPANYSNPGERHFIVDSWVSSYQFAHAAGPISVDRWYSVMIPEIERTLDRPEIRTFVAYKTDEPDHMADLQGFIAVDTEWRLPIVFYVFVKEGYRKAGIARGLFRAASVDPLKPFMHPYKTGASSSIHEARKTPSATFEPNFARFAKDDPRRPRKIR